MKAIIFDLDGTLLNTLSDIANSMNTVLMKHNFPIYQTEQYRFLVGDGMNSLVKKAATPYTEKPELILLMQNEMKDEYEKNWHKQTKPYPLIMETLTQLQREGFLLSVLSNKPDRLTKISVSFFFPQIHFFMIKGALETIKKPNPSGVYDIIKTSNLPSTEFIMIGDSAVDMITAKNASIFPAGVLWGFRDKEELIQNGAKQIFTNPKEILFFLNHLKQIGYKIVI